MNLPQALVLGVPHRYISAMSRIPIAIVGGLIGFFGYVAAVIVAADTVQTLHWAIQAVYFVLAGTLWALPIRWLMFWSVGQR